MYRRIISKIIFLLLGLYSLFFAGCAILAPICAGLGLYDVSAKAVFMMSGACHQNPLRSFWFFGYPSALCARCLGFYTGSMLFSFLELFHRLTIKKIFFILISFFVLSDLFLNVIFSVDTGIIIRFAAGFGMAFIFVKFIQFIFNKGGII